MRAPVNAIVAEAVRDAAKRYGSDISFLFGDWAYITSRLEIWGRDAVTAEKKYPVICMLSPFDEDRTDRETTVSLEFIILVNTRKDYDNGQREAQSFQTVLRPVYEAFMESLGHSRHVRFVPHIPHVYRENYRYGRLGVIGDAGRVFSDYVDAIELRNVKLKLKDFRCYERNTSMLRCE